MNIKRAFVVLLGLLIVFSSASGVAIAKDDVPEWEPCNDSSSTSSSDNSGNSDEEDSSTAATFKLILTMLSALGPLFGSLFFVLMTVASAATTKSDGYDSARKKALLYGFSVPISIAFLGVFSNELTPGTDISCFFP